MRSSPGLSAAWLLAVATLALPACAEPAASPPTPASAQLPAPAAPAAIPAPAPALSPPPIEHAAQPAPWRPAHPGPVRAAILDFGAPRSWQGVVGDTLGLEVTADAWAKAVPLLEHDRVDLVVVRANSGGGLESEASKFIDLFEHVYKPKFHVVCWVESAISQAALAVWPIEDFVFMPEGNLGSCTCTFFGGDPAPRWTLVNLEQHIALGEHASDFGRHSRFIMRSMQIMEPLSYSIDSAGKVTWFQNAASVHVLNPESHILTLSADTAVASGFARGVAATKDDLAKVLGLDSVEWTGQAAADAIDQSMKDGDRTEKRLSTLLDQYVQALRAAESLTEPARRREQAAKARAVLPELRTALEETPNFFVVNDLDTKWFAGQEKLLGELDKDPAAPLVPAAASAPTMCVITLAGEFGHDVAVPPLRAALAEARAVQPDVLVVKVDCTPTPPSKFGQAPGNLQHHYELALDLAVNLDIELLNVVGKGSLWAKPPRLVMWVKSALGASAVVPFVASDIYFTSDAREGGLGLLIESPDPNVVIRRQRSLPWARAEGLAIKGRHNYRLARAIVLNDYILSVTFSDNGEPAYYEDLFGAELLTDGGASTHHADTPDQIEHFTGNDSLVLDAAHAVKLQYAKGVADTPAELAAKLGLDAGFKLVSARDAIFRDWSAKLAADEAELEHLRQEVDQTPDAGNTLVERNAARLQLLKTLSRIDELSKADVDALDWDAYKFPKHTHTLGETAELIAKIKRELEADRP